jgi:hypothetical protein
MKFLQDFGFILSPIISTLYLITYGGTLARLSIDINLKTS